MGTTAQKLNRLLETKNGLREIINAKGVSVSENDTFNSYIDKVAAIPSDMAEATITANGTYRASDQGIDGFSSVIVNVDTGGSGGGGGASLGTKTITENGTYNATADGLDGYYSVEVEVPNTGTLIDKTITEVGTFNPVDDGADGYSSVTVDIDPETMAAPDDKFTVNFYIGDELKLNVQNVPYGGSAVYPNSNLIGIDPNYGYFYGWNPAPNNIRRNTNCYAMFSGEARPFEVNEIYQPWEDIISNKGIDIPIGMYRWLHLETVEGVQYGSVRMQKVYEGEGASNSTWLAMDIIGANVSFSDEADREHTNWDNSKIRTLLNGTFFDSAMPQSLKNAIIQVPKFSLKTYKTGQGYVTTSDKIWIPSAREVGLDYGATQCPSYSSIFTDDTSRIRSVNTTTIDGTNMGYYLRDSNPDGGMDTSTYGINTKGQFNNNNSKTQGAYWRGMVIGFCL